MPTQGSHSWEIGNDGVASSDKEGARGSSSKPGGVEGVTNIPCVPSLVKFRRKLKVVAVCLPRGLLHEGYAKNSEGAEILPYLQASKFDAHCFLDTGRIPQTPGTEQKDSF